MKDNESNTICDRCGEKISIPEMYYKVLLKKQKNITPFSAFNYFQELESCEARRSYEEVYRADLCQDCSYVLEKVIREAIGDKKNED